jgi:hypothetical protein
MGDTNRREDTRERDLVGRIERLSRKLGRADAARDAIAAERDAAQAEFDGLGDGPAPQEIGPVAWRRAPARDEPARPTRLRWRFWDRRL